MHPRPEETEERAETGGRDMALPGAATAAVVEREAGEHMAETAETAETAEFVWIRNLGSAPVVVLDPDAVAGGKGGIGGLGGAGGMGGAGGTGGAGVFGPSPNGDAGPNAGRQANGRSGYPGTPGRIIIN